jgi:hypothetical protein
MTVSLHMWYPNKSQWSVIWIVTIMCLIGWLRSDPEPEAFLMPAMLIGGLFIWHVSQDFGGTKG